MPDPHMVRNSSLRLPPDLKAKAHEALKTQPERDEPWTLHELLVAFVAMFVKRPKSVLKMLEPFKPPRKRGRPRKGS